MEEKKDREEKQALFVISVAAEIVGMHPQTLRIYERAGLIAPKRTVKGSRRYSREDIERLLYIRELTRDYGVNLAGAKMLIELRDRMQHLEELVAELEERSRVFEREMDTEIDRIHRSYSRAVVPFHRREIMGR